MRPLLPGLALALLLGAAPPAPAPTAATGTAAALAKGESLEDFARRVLGDARAASELRALNGLQAGQQPAPGATLRLPGPERELALGAVSALRNALTQAPPEAAQRKEAQAAMAQAELLLREAKYAQAAKAADAAWQRVSTSASQPTAFTVDVADSGATSVHARAGKPVRVEAEGVVRPVYAGQHVTVEKGQAPTSAAQPLAAPQLLQPAHEKKLTFAAPAKAATPRLGPVTLAWSEVPGARGYEVEVVPPAGAALRLSVEGTRARLPPLTPGLYRWNVRALGPSIPGEASASREFELAASSLKLEVKGSSWK